MSYKVTKIRNWNIGSGLYLIHCHIYSVNADKLCLLKYKGKPNYLNSESFRENESSQ